MDITGCEEQGRDRLSSVAERLPLLIGTRQSEIAGYCFAAVLVGNDVVDLEW
jgi:hypothetical protein